MISVVIPTYQKPDLLERTLGALSEQRVSSPWEVIVVDDGSADRTSDVIRSFKDRLPIRAEHPPSNEGRAKARNRGWRAASGTSVLFLDDDIVLEPGALAAHAAAQSQHPAAYLGEVRTDPSVVDSALFAYLDSRGVAKLPWGTRVPARYFLTQNASVPTDALRTVGGFDEDFGAYGFEDMEIAFRFEDQARLEFYSLDGSRGWHVHHHSLDEYFDKKRICGRETLPRLAELHPQRLAEMRLDIVVQPSSALEGGSRWLSRALRTSYRMGAPWVARTLLALWPHSGGGGAFRLFDYTVMASYDEGWQTRKADKNGTVMP